MQGSRATVRDAKLLQTGLSDEQRMMIAGPLDQQRSSENLGQCSEVKASDSRVAG
jgi:hypothetical protein